MSTFTPTDSRQRTAAGSPSTARLRSRVGWGAALPVGLLVVSYAFGREAQVQTVSQVLLILAGVAAGGALGGLAIHLTSRLRHHGGWRAWIGTLVAGVLYATAVVAGFIVGSSGPH